jgi:hypothetical protein
MTNESQAFFAAVTPPKGASSSALTDQLYAEMEQLHVVVAGAQARMATLRLLLAKADRTEEDITVYAKFERFKQTFGAIERELAAVGTAAGLLTDASFRLDEHGRDASERLAP